ncbi:MAG: septum formation initiator family protein [Candidatus Rokubacteria bacterium]|nr:septum formation initiator family protein [Candidatus Rokubacteria bacterium]
MNRRAIQLPLAVLVALGVLGWGGTSLARVWRMKQEVRSLEREIGALRVEAARLTGAIERVRTDPDFVEQLAREQLGLVRPGERVLKLPPTPALPPARIPGGG